MFFFGGGFFFAGFAFGMKNVDQFRLSEKKPLQEDQFQLVPRNNTTKTISNVIISIRRPAVINEILFLDQNNFNSSSSYILCVERIVWVYFINMNLDTEQRPDPKEKV